MTKWNYYSRRRTSINTVETSTTGATTTGALAVSIYNNGTANGTVEGRTLEPGQGLEWSVNGPYDDISYDATATTFQIWEELDVDDDD